MKSKDFIQENIVADAAEMHQDHEVQMARSDCYTAAKYAIELHKMLHKISEQQGLDGWVSEKITLANDYLRTVHEYLSHEMAMGDEHAEVFALESAEARFAKLLGESEQDVAEGRDDDDDIWTSAKSGGPKGLPQGRRGQTGKEQTYDWSKKYDDYAPDDEGDDWDEYDESKKPVKETTSSASIATAPGKATAKAGTLFGGSYQQPKSPFKAKKK